MRRSKVTPIALFTILIMLAINLINSILTYIDYHKRIQSGNERWLQVEERIEQVERCCNCGRNS